MSDLNDNRATPPPGLNESSSETIDKIGTDLPVALRGNRRKPHHTRGGTRTVHACCSTTPSPPSPRSNRSA